MNTVTRKLDEFEATAYQIEQTDDGPQLGPIATVTYVATTGDTLTARRELESQGYQIPRGTYIEVKCVCTHKYTATLDAFLQIATDEIL